VKNVGKNLLEMLLWQHKYETVTTLSKGQVRLTNPDKNVAVEMLYDVNDFPVTLQWKSMISGDYALGIEPSLTRFDQFKMQVLKANESKTYKIEINFQ
jgi:galactose mutarotase-like enzyme